MKNHFGRVLGCVYLSVLSLIDTWCLGWPDYGYIRLCYISGQVRALL